MSDPWAREDKCEGRFCDQLGAAFNDDGEFLCVECLEEWAYKEGYEEFEFHGPDPNK